MTTLKIVFGCLVIGAGLLGLIANCIEIVLICRDKKQRNSQFGTVLLSLSTSDLFVSLTCLVLGTVSLLFNLMIIDLAYFVKIIIFIEFSFAFSFATSFSHVVVIAMQRLIAVMLPLQAKRIITIHRSRLLVVFLWVFSLVLAVTVHFTSMMYVISPVALVTGVALVVNYAIICWKMKKQQSLLADHQLHRPATQSPSQIFLHSFAVTIIYVICYFPDSMRVFVQYPLAVVFLCYFLASLNPFLDALVYFILRYHKQRTKTAPEVRLSMRRKSI